MGRGKRCESAELLMVVIFAFLLKLFAGRNTLTEKGIVLPGYDDYFHMRRIFYTVNHFPNTLWFDSYLKYPKGAGMGSPPLFDQISAVLCIILGQHSKTGVENVSIYVPVLIGSMAVVVVYYLISELFDRRVAILASIMTGLAPYYLLDTMLGATDHHCLEVLLLLCTLLFLAMALCRSERWYLFAIISGVMMAALAYTWSGAGLYLGIIPVYAALQMTVDLKRGASSKEMVTIILAAFGVAMVLLLPFWNSYWLTTSFLGLATMIVAMLVMFAISRLMAQRKMPWTAFLPSIAGLVLVLALLITPICGLFGVGYNMQHGLERLAEVWNGHLIEKVGEAEPLIYNAKTFSDVVFSYLGLNLLFSLAGIAALAIRIRRSDDGKMQGQLLLLVWAATTILFTFGQSRFLYVSTIAMGILISILFFQILEQVEKRMARAKVELSIGQIAAILLLFLVLPTAVQAFYFAVNAPHDVAGDWYESLSWLKENSNITSYYDDPVKNAEYSVMSWWDYGYWIVYLAERPVVSSNNLGGIKYSAKFYLSESEEEAVAVLDAKGSRYVIVNYDLLFGKLPALAAWAGEDIDSYVKLVNSGSRVGAVPQPRLFNTTLARLYLFDGAGMSHFRLIYESPTLVGENPFIRREVKIFEYVPEVSNARIKKSNYS